MKTSIEIQKIQEDAKNSKGVKHNNKIEELKDRSE